MDNYQDVVHQMERFGIVFRKHNDLPLRIDTPKRKTCGEGGKYWYKLYTFRPDDGPEMIVGSFGTYKHGGSSMKVEVDWQPLTDAARERHRAEREAAKIAAAAERKANAELAAMNAMDLWRKASPAGGSPYLQRKGLAGESCRYLPDGTLVIPLIRYDLDRASALQAVQRVLPDGRKFYSKGFEKPGCAVRLGAAGEVSLLLVCEGYATGLSIRLAVDGQYPVFVAFDAGNLVHVVRMLRALYPTTRLLICADDDWKTVDPRTQRPSNPGRTTARKVAKEISGCDLVWPVFDPSTRQEKDTDFDDLRQRQGLLTVQRQLQGVIEAMGRRYG